MVALAAVGLGACIVGFVAAAGFVEAVGFVAASFVAAGFVAAGFAAGGGRGAVRGAAETDFMQRYRGRAR